MEDLLFFWSGVLWFGLEFWITNPANKKARIAEIITGIVYMVGGSVAIATAEAPGAAAAVGSVIALFGIYHVTGASKDEYDYYV